jgi:hypothetical protein
MSLVHMVRCDICKTTAPTRYNGEHHLPPNGWAGIWDEATTGCTDEHLCPLCRPNSKKGVTKKTQKSKT